MYTREDLKGLHNMGYDADEACLNGVVESHLEALDIIAQLRTEVVELKEMRGWETRGH